MPKVQLAHAHFLNNVFNIQPMREAHENASQHVWGQKKTHVVVEEAQKGEEGL